MRTVTLAPRANAVVYTTAQVNEALTALDGTHYPAAVIIDETGLDTINAARNRANTMREAISARGVKCRAHGIEQDGKFYPALTLPRPPREPKRAKKNSDAAKQDGDAPKQDAPKQDAKTTAKK